MPSSPIEVLLPHQPAQAPRPAAVTDGEHHSLFIALAAVPDPRDPRGKRYPLVSMLAVAVCAVLAGRRWRLVIAVDGKVERGARLPDGRQVHLLSAYDTSAGVVLAQVQIAA